MALINVNMDAELKPQFETVQAGSYNMRIKEAEDYTSQKGTEMIKLTLEFVEPPMNLTNLEGQPCKAVGNIFDYIMLDADKQWKLRQLTEAVGLPWGNYDPIAELPQKEVKVQLKLEAYEGNQTNKVGRYIIG